MAPLPVIANCVRISCNWSAASGVQPVNVFHVITNSTDEAQIGADLEAAMLANEADMWQALSSSCGLDSFTITLLDGSSAGQVIPVTADITGSQGGEIIPSAAAVLSLHTLQRGPRGRGRIFIGPISELTQANGLLAPTVPGVSVTGWNNFNDDIAASSSSMSLGVASYVHAEVGGVTSISMRNQYGSQRRRQNQLV